jgi:hypothetical protein
MAGPKTAGPTETAPPYKTHGGSKDGSALQFYDPGGRHA